MKTNKYFYRPIAFFGGAVLKCAGICLEEEAGGVKANKEWFTEKCEKPEHPYMTGVIIVEGYRGDRINAADHSLYTG